MARDIWAEPTAHLAPDSKALPLCGITVYKSVMTTPWSHNLMTSCKPLNMVRFIGWELDYIKSLLQQEGSTFQATYTYARRYHIDQSLISPRSQPSPEILSHLDLQPRAGRVRSLLRAYGLLTRVSPYQDHILFTLFSPLVCGIMSHQILNHWYCFTSKNMINIKITNFRVWFVEDQF